MLVARVAPHGRRRRTASSTSSPATPAQLSTGAVRASLACSCSSLPASGLLSAAQRVKHATEASLQGARWILRGLGRPIAPLIQRVLNAVAQVVGRSRQAVGV